MPCNKAGKHVKGPFSNSVSGRVTGIEACTLDGGVLVIHASLENSLSPGMVRACLRIPPEFVKALRAEIDEHHSSEHLQKG